MLAVDTVITGAQGGPFYNRLHFAEQGGSVGAQDAANAVRAFWLALQTVVDNLLNFQVSGEVAIVSAATGQQTGTFFITQPAAVQGASTNEPLPWTTQGLIRLRTGTFVNGREVRGRIFIPGLTESASDDGRVNSSARSFMQGAIDALIADTDSLLHVYSPTHGVSALVTGASVWTEWASLRSRRD